MNLLEHYPDISANYPEYINKEQMRLICHISKKTARFLLQSGLVPCINNGKKTRNYQIATADVIEYLKRREVTPEKYILPKDEYTRVSAISIPDCRDVSPIDFSLFEEYPDVLSIGHAAELSRATPNTIKEWIEKKYFRAFKKNNTYHIPKLALIEYLSLPQYKQHQNNPNN